MTMTDDERPMTETSSSVLRHLSDFSNKYSSRERHGRALLHLLKIVGLTDQASKLPSIVLGGPQQRAAIAHTLANDPPNLTSFNLLVT
jgi:ABC-type polar amino acid transport system ATPase subunit